MIRFEDLPRNDPKAAAAYFEQALDDGTFTPSLGQMLVMMQDDPTELFAVLDTVTERRTREGLPLPA